ncbi:hypothetical protein NQ318_012680 [Aromia moschata]|uniref:Uncharacterized protein n=1 Tax=Aromia moschata TaxID=1265417 RepID=A0AAV8YJJ4_9CUCU|nr:hypothetical protein NQ318_012680 [Aromia moschata]
MASGGNYELNAGEIEKQIWVTSVTVKMNISRSNKLFSSFTRNPGSTTWMWQKYDPFGVLDFRKYVKLACLWITEVIHVLVRCAQLKELLLLPKVCVKTQKPQLVTEHSNNLIMNDNRRTKLQMSAILKRLESVSKSAKY